MTLDSQARAEFKTMVDSTEAEWQLISKNARRYQRELPERVIAHLELLRDDFGGFAVDRLEHSLQTATRAVEDGRDEEYVVCALLHDIGDTLGPAQHADVAAIILKPYVSEKNHWMVEKHAIFQGYYFFHHLGFDRNMRDEYKNHEYYQYTAEFCHKYDQNSFDPDYKSMPLQDFVPAIESVMSKPKRGLLVPE
ncbi:MAG: HD domain-containing protein [Pseudomonadota bacterium]